MAISGHQSGPAGLNDYRADTQSQITSEEEEVRNTTCMYTHLQYMSVLDNPLVVYPYISDSEGPLVVYQYMSAVEKMMAI